MSTSHLHTSRSGDRSCVSEVNVRLEDLFKQDEISLLNYLSGPDSPILVGSRRLEATWKVWKDSRIETPIKEAQLNSIRSKAAAARVAHAKLEGKLKEIIYLSRIVKVVLRNRAHSYGFQEGVFVLDEREATPIEISQYLRKNPRDAIAELIEKMRVLCCDYEYEVDAFESLLRNEPISEA